jgi:8-oxo-dGTP pyrophosphatase MutT (NUDIX family)
VDAEDELDGGLSDQINEHGVRMVRVANGVARVSWSSELQAQGFEAASQAVRDEVALAIETLKQARVEALVDPDDVLGARIATWAGLHREGVMRGAVEEDGERRDRVVFARLHTDAPIFKSRGFRALLNSFLPRKRAIAQMLVRDTEGRVLLCNLTYKDDWDLPGGVVEVNESPLVAVTREIEEELALTIRAGRLVLTDWLPPWSGWDDAVCLVFDGGTHGPEVLARVVMQEREIRDVRFCTLDEVDELAADFTARRVRAAVAGTQPYTESGR